MGIIKKAKLDMITGPMFSSKSAALLQRLIDKKNEGHSVLLLRPNIDNREFISRDKYISTKASNIETIITDNIFDVPDSEYDKYTVIGIDEAQFFKDIELILDKWINVTDDNKKKIVIVSSLTMTSEMKMFDSVWKLFPWVNSFKKLHAICSDCGSSADFTYYLGGEKTEEIIVGNDTYIPLCRECYCKREFGE